MLVKSDVSVVDALKILNGHDISAGFIVPTDTSMTKSIMDATFVLRKYLKDQTFHDYDMQSQGAPAKIVKKAYFVDVDNYKETSVSLYRPETKDGDPRIWIYGLKSYAEPFNLLALIVLEEALYVVNMSRKDLVESLNTKGTPLHKLAQAVRKEAESPSCLELLSKLREVCSRGFLPNLRQGDTGVGMTLESALGIKSNSNKAPDYKGIEIKTKRHSSRSPTRSTLFSQAPNWPLSPIGSAWNLLVKYGYHRNGKLRFNHEIDAAKANSAGFILELDHKNDWLKQNHKDSSHTTHVVTWQLDTLRDRLAEKHKETFWVKALSRGPKTAEEFHYVEVLHTRNPNIQGFETLLESGIITVDYLISQKGSTSVRDHGYLFKIHQRDINALFPPPKIYELRM